MSLPNLDNKSKFQPLPGTVVSGWPDGRMAKQTQSTEALQNLGRVQGIYVQTREGKISPAGTQRQCSSAY